MSSSNCCFLTCIQVSQEAGQVGWYSHLVQNFPQFIVIHTVEGFGVDNKAEIDVFLELPSSSCLTNACSYQLSQHCVLQRSLNAPNICHAPCVHPSKPHLEPQATTECFTLSKDLHFPECKIDGTLQYVGF